MSSEHHAVRRAIFITPNLDNDMQDGSIGQGDAWLASEIPSSRRPRPTRTAA
jgi:hypothetical protein